MLNKRLLGVFHQYPDPRVGFVVGEILLSTLLPRSGYGGYYLGTESSFRLQELKKAGFDVTEMPLFELLVRTDLYDVIHRADEDSIQRRPDKIGLMPRSAIRDYFLHTLSAGRWYNANDPETRSLAMHTQFDRLVPWLAWLTNHVLKYVDRNEVVPGTRGHRRYTPYNSFVEWAATAVQHLGSIADWVQATNYDLLGDRLRLSQAQYRSARWHAELVRQRKLDNLVPGAVVFSWSDGWTVQKLTTRAQLKGEGDYQGHCVGQYLQRDTTIYSLRDMKGIPHVTIEVQDYPTVYIRQVKGRGNNLVKSWRLCARLYEFFGFLQSKSPDAYEWNYVWDMRPCLQLYKNVQSGQS